MNINNILKKIIPLFKFLIGILLFLLAAILIVLHNFTNLNGNAAPYSGSDFNVNNLSDVTKLVETNLRKTQWMNFKETFLWIFIPSIILTILFGNFISKKLKIKDPIKLFAFVFVIIYFVAQTTNIVGISLKLYRDIPVWQKMAEIIESSNVRSYSAGYNTGGIGSNPYASISYESRLSISELKNIYRGKNFVEIPEKSIDLLYLEQDPNYYLDIFERNGKTFVKVSNTKLAR